MGCAAKPTPLSDVLTALTSDSFGLQGSPALLAKLNPAYRYLRIEVDGRSPALLVLGYVDPHPQGDIEVWYSAKQELVKLQNGRIVGTAGLEVDWRAVRFPSAPPAWTELNPVGNAYQRLRDEMPGYRYAVGERMEIKPWADLPPIKLADSLPNKQALTYHWFREATLDDKAERLPPSWFALGWYNGKNNVVYSEQCLSASFCLKMQLWPIQEGAS